RDLTLEIGRSDAIYLIGGEHNRIAGCTVRNVGGNGVILHGGKKSGVVSSDLYDLGRGGVVLMGGDRKTLDPGGLFVENSHIHHYSQIERAYLPAVHLRDGIGNRAAHNLIHDAPHCGILYSGNDHRIEFNELHHLVLDTSDAGVLYSGFDWTSRGNIVRHNFFHDIPHLPDGYTRVVYLDDAHSSTATIGNVFYRTHQSVWIGGGRDNRVENNVFIDCDEPVNIDNRGLRWTFLNPNGDLRTTRMYKKLVEISHDAPPWSERYPKLARILNENPRAPVGNTLKRNLYVRSNWRDPEAWCREHSPRHVTTKYMDIVDNFATEKDPGFVDAKGLNFALRSNAVVYEKIPGFQPIPFERIGLYVDEYRIELPLRR
ncbi:MAG: right-handed parallel beta-helix repeat-containing protein, partial [Planctomycetes bacterium]|nr:right-handed parallel beta-helix repeat-containing protein [Planctomycetota bacterium]